MRGVLGVLPERYHKVLRWHWFAVLIFIVALLLLYHSYSGFAAAKLALSQATEEARWFAEAKPALETIAHSQDAVPEERQRQSMLARVNQMANRLGIRITRVDFRESGLMATIEPTEFEPLLDFIFLLQRDHQIIAIEASVFRDAPGVARARLLLQDSR